MNSPQWPSGIVTFLFTDIEGSTRLLDKLGEDYAQLVAQHHELLRQVWREFGGHEVDAVGDSFLVAFASGIEAIEAAAEAQRCLAHACWPAGIQIKVRMGAHTGFAHPRNNQYVAMAVHQASRVVSAANGGQVLLTEACFATLSEAQRPMVEALGPFRVRDFDRPVPLYRLIPDHWTGDDRAPRVRPAAQHNLVRSINPFLGREREIDELGRQVRAGRMVSVVGQGGMGKSRLASEFGLTAVSRWRDGVWFVALEACRNRDEIIECLVETLSVSRETGAAGMPELLAHIEHWEALLILDNCEQVADDCASIAAELLTANPSLALIGTSQRPLNLRVERVLKLTSLSAEGAEQAPAVQLFLEQSPTVPESEMSTIVALCAQLDGVPLAIELAAARAKTMPPSLILSELESSLSILDVSDPGLPDRHRSLAGVIDWSYRLLEGPDKKVLSRLAVFADDFPQSAAVAVCTTGALAPEAVPAVLWRLLERSLLRLDDTTGGSRFRLTTSVRLHAWAQLSTEERSDAVQSYALHLLETFPLDAAYKTSWQRGIGAEVANIRHAVRELAAVDQQTGQALAWMLLTYLEKHASKAVAIAEARGYLRMFDAEVPERVGIYHVLLLLLELSEHGDAFAAVLADAQALLAKVGPPSAMPHALVARSASHLWRQGQPGEALAILDEAIQQSTSAYALQGLENVKGIIQSMTGEEAASLDSFHRAAQHCRAADMRGEEVFVLGNLAEMLMRDGQWPEAARQQLLALEAGRSLDIPWALACSLMLAAQLLPVPDQGIRACQLAAAGIRICEECGRSLYPEDREPLDSLLERMQAELGAERYRAAIADSEGWSLTQAADFATAALERIAAGVTTT